MLSSLTSIFIKKAFGTIGFYSQFGVDLRKQNSINLRSIPIQLLLELATTRNFHKKKVQDWMTFRLKF